MFFASLLVFTLTATTLDSSAAASSQLLVNPGSVVFVQAAGNKASTSNTPLCFDLIGVLSAAIGAVVNAIISGVLGAMGNVIGALVAGIASMFAGLIAGIVSALLGVVTTVVAAIIGAIVGGLFGEKPPSQQPEENVTTYLSL